MYQILLYGEIVSYVNADETITSKKLFNELLLANGQDLEISINTLGGDVSEAFAIVSMLEDYKTKHNVTIKTIAIGECASSGVLLLLAGDVREVKSNCKPFIHNVWTIAQGDANDFINLGYELEDANYEIAKFYSEITGIDYDLARELMGLNTSLTSEECELLGFATSTKKEVETEQLVLLNKLTKQKTNQINTMEKNEKGLFNLLKNFFTGQSTIQNEKEVHTAEGETIVFSELDTDDSVEVGDEATIDGQQVEGEVTTLEGDVIDFEKGVVTEIIEAELVEEIIEEEESELIALKAELESLKAEFINLKNQNVELITFKNKVTSTTSKEASQEAKSINNTAVKFDTAEYLKRKQNFKK